MDTKTLQEAADRIAKIMGARGLREPVFTFQIDSDAQPNAHARWTTQSDRYQYSYEWFKGDNYGDVMAAANLWVEDLPSIEETRRQEFTRALATAIELGKASGIDATLVNPLEAAMKKLSKNALTHEAGKK